ncbi:MAG: hypothetical protein M3Q91_17285 [Acidobacteriota bacterium]|nr:hypothetical protein [Acidobacteriota bacterium]
MPFAARQSIPALAFKGVAMIALKVMLSIIVVFVACTSSFAKLMGQGEATGEVVESWLSGGRVIFRLNISGQKN